MDGQGEQVERVVTGIRIYADIDGATVWWTDIPINHHFALFNTAFSYSHSAKLKFTAAPIIQPTIIRYYNCDRRHCEEFDE